MDAFTKQITLSFAYKASENVTEVTVDQLFWSLDRFDYDRKECDEGAREQRFEATQRLAVELDRRNIPMRNPTLPVNFPRDYPGQRPRVNM